MEVDQNLIAAVKKIGINDTGLYQWDGKSLHSLYGNVRIQEYTGMSREEFDAVVQGDFVNMVVKEDREKSMRQLNEMVKNQESGVFSFRIYHKDRFMTWLRVEAKYMGEMNGEPVIMAYFSSLSGEEAVFETLVDRLNDIIYVIDKQSHELLYMNDYALKTSDYRNYVGMKCHKYLNNIDEPCPWCSLPMIKNGKAHVAENYVPPQGRWYEHDVFDINWYNYDAAAFYLTDITEKKNLEKIKVKGQYQRILNANPDALALYAANLTRNTIGDGQCSSRAVWNRIDLDNCDSFFASVEKMIMDKAIQQRFAMVFKQKALLEEYYKGITEETIVYPILNHLGEKMWIKGTVSMVENPVNNDIEAVIYAVNVTHNKKLEKVVQRITLDDYDFVALIDRRKKTVEQIMMSEKSDIVRSYETVDYNTVLKQLMIGKTNPAETQNHLDKLQYANILKKLETDGSVIYPYTSFSAKKQPLRKQLKFIWLAEARDFILMTRTDITAAYQEEQRQLERLTETMKKLEIANNAKTDFVSRISHDIRTPISAIVSMTQFAKEDIDHKDQLMDDIKKIEGSNAFLMSLINDILDVSKIDSGKMELYPEPYPYEEYIANVSGMFAPMCADKGLTFKILNNRSIGATAIVDKVRLNQITMNLLSNAVKYTPKGGTVTYDSQTQRLPGNKVKVQFTISDTGIGMSEEFQKRMFEEFTQEDSEYRKEHGVSGTGLGLAIVKRIIDLMNGTIEVWSRLNEGTSVTVTLVLPSGTAPMVQGESKTLSASLNLPHRLNLSILVVEDNEINREIAARILNHLGAETEFAFNGAEGAEKFRVSKKGQYDVILMDIQMPVMDGFEAAGQIRRMDRSDAGTVPIIAMSANVFDTSIQAAKKAGMNDYLTKPVDPEKVYEVLSKYQKK